jgi:hypothetical protein
MQDHISVLPVFPRLYIRFNPKIGELLLFQAFLFSYLLQTTVQEFEGDKNSIG